MTCSIRVELSTSVVSPCTRYQEQYSLNEIISLDSSKVNQKSVNITLTLWSNEKQNFRRGNKFNRKADWVLTKTTITTARFV